MSVGETLREGATLTFQGAATCEEGSAVTVTFTVGPAATQGEGLGAPSLSPTSVGETFRTPRVERVVYVVPLCGGRDGGHRRRVRGSSSCPAKPC